MRLRAITTHLQSFILSGSIDLSVGPIVAFCGLLTGYLMNMPFIVMLAVALVAGALVGMLLRVDAPNIGLVKADHLQKRVGAGKLLAGGGDFYRRVGRHRHTGHGGVFEMRHDVAFLIDRKSVV